MDGAYSHTASAWTDQGEAVSLQGANSPLGQVGTAELIPYLQQDGTTGINLYTGQYYPVTGTVFGTAVKGMFVIDHFIGTELFGASALAGNEIVWFKFANVFADGSVHPLSSSMDLDTLHSLSTIAWSEAVPQEP